MNTPPEQAIRRIPVSRTRCAPSRMSIASTKRCTPAATRSKRCPASRDPRNSYAEYIDGTPFLRRQPSPFTGKFEQRFENARRRRGLARICHIGSQPHHFVFVLQWRHPRCRVTSAYSRPIESCSVTRRHPRQLAALVPDAHRGRQPVARTVAGEHQDPFLRSTDTCNRPPKRAPDDAPPAPCAPGSNPVALKRSARATPPCAADIPGRRTSVLEQLSASARETRPSSVSSRAKSSRSATGHSSCNGRSMPCARARSPLP